MNRAERAGNSRPGAWALSSAGLALAALGAASLAVAVPCAACQAAPPTLIPASGAELVQKVREPGANAVLVNMWATWCVPCREEFPDLLRLRREYAGRGLRVLLVSGDFDSESAAARQFLREQGVDFPTYLKVGRDMEFINAFEPRWSGVLPATFIYDAKGMLRHVWEQKTSYATLEAGVLEVLQPAAREPAKEDAS